MVDRDTQSSTANNADYLTALPAGGNRLGKTG